MIRTYEGNWIPGRQCNECKQVYAKTGNVCPKCGSMDVKMAIVREVHERTESLWKQVFWMFCDLRDLSRSYYEIHPSKKYIKTGYKDFPVVSDKGSDR